MKKQRKIKDELSDKEFYLYQEAERKWRAEKDNLTRKDYLEIFPELVYDIGPRKIRELEVLKRQITKSIKMRFRWLRDNYAGTERGRQYIYLLIQDVEGRELIKVERQLDFFKGIVPLEGSVFNKYKKYNRDEALRFPIEGLIPNEELRRNSKGYSCCCLFHEDETPSFFIYTASNSYYCFGCKRGGNVINFTRELYGLSYVDALRLLTSI